MTLKQARQALESHCQRSKDSFYSFVELDVDDKIAHVLIQEFPNMIFSKGKDNFTAKNCKLCNEAMAEKKQIDNFWISSANVPGVNTLLELHYDFRDLYPQLEFKLLADGKTMIIVREPFEKIKSKVCITSKNTTPP